MRSYLRIVVPVVFVGACGTGTEPTPPNPLVTALQQVSWGEFNNYQNHVITGYVPPIFPVSAYVPGNCSYGSTDQTFSCPTQALSGFAWMVKYQLFDAAGAAQSAFDEHTTDRVRVIVDAGGPVSTRVPSNLVHHHGDLTLTGMLGTRRTVNGVSVDHDTTATNIAIDASATVTDLIFDGATSAFPSSGAITIDVVETYPSGPLGTVHAALTFTGLGVANFSLRHERGQIATASCTVDFRFSGPNGSCAAVTAPSSIAERQPPRR
jgi:hypothetical protein